MRRMFSEKQIQGLAQEQALDISVEKINELAVRKISAPESTTLTDEEIETINKGIFIEGTFLGYTNPVLFPTLETGSAYRGILIAGSSLGVYVINKTTKGISLVSETTKLLNARSIGSVNGKSLPDYPADSGTFVLKCVDGTLTWVEEV